VPISFSVNGDSLTTEADPTTPLLYILMDDLGLNGPKFGCGLAQCGACTVLLNGAPIRSCVRPISGLQGAQVTTIEGLGSTEQPDPIQAAFIQEQAAQCAFCISGIMLYGKTFIDSNPNATDTEILGALNGLLCRCYSHTRMLRALRRYADEVRL
jgi:nicotinate dehydrogenase subunit A